MTESNGHRQRVQWWSVLALLRALASSPAAAAATLRTRATTVDTETSEEADTIGRRAVLDLTDDESAEGIDLAPGSDAEAEGDDKARHRRRLQEMARTADSSSGRTGYEACRSSRHPLLTSEGLRELLAEDSQVLAFAGSSQSAEWLTKDQAEALLEVIPDANIAPELQRDALQRILDGASALMPHLESVAQSRAAELLDAHRRVRSAARLRGVSQRVEPQLPPDILGIYVFLPVPAAGGQA